MVYIYGDGGCRPTNPGPGAWAVLLKSSKHNVEREISGYEKHTTNNRMELSAIIHGFKELKRSGLDVTIVSDSSYVINGMTKWINGWIKRGWITATNKDVENKDLWVELMDLSSKHNVTWTWVKGHSGHIENERVDELVALTIKSNIGIAL